MTFRSIVAILVALAAIDAWGQAARPATTPRVLAIDRIVAVVNDEAITQYELDDAKRVVLQQLKQQKVAQPPADVLDKQVLERLITERALLQYAKDNGIKVDDVQVERTIQRIAEDNKMTPDDMRKALARDNIPYAKYREDVRNEITMQKVREREVDNRITVSDSEVDLYLATIKAQSGGEAEYRIAHILVVVPEQANTDQIDARRRRAEEALRSIKTGGDFAQVAAAFSDAGDALQGGNLGWRQGARLPTVFAETVRKMKVGDVSPVLRSPAGFHIVKLLDKRSHDEPAVVDQTHARHILVRVNEITSEADAKVKDDRLGIDLKPGRGEDLFHPETPRCEGRRPGLVQSGDTVPAFEDAMNKLAIKQVQAPVRTTFGWHLIEVIARRKQDVTADREPRRRSSRSAAQTTVR
jgi:peptidyl-prolyl cis-trans isomerase SurA